ncbi:MarR family winged helix-turn-helix transcriptional regulator [Glutamicibacter sp. JC586]|uniref:MarR family winged helix-turn-helix transcriptional regulator n=1 Tax=Glutamicibacter sp. JC586 TaxID=2590552 RepID=UPI0013584B6F|nr:MarR family transcriptional regulator [Glutamicibacter sp. JC586]
MDVINSEADSCGQERADRYSMAEQELFSLLAVTSRFKRELAVRLDGQLTPGYLPVLGLILRHGRITQSEICDRILIDKATLSRMISKLGQLNLIVREVNTEDRRAFDLLPTELARERWHSGFEQWRGELRSRMTNWEDQDLDTLVHLLGRLNLEIQAI